MEEPLVDEVVHLVCGVARTLLVGHPASEGTIHRRRTARSIHDM